jgi:histidine ammonia-lyase
VVFVDGRTLTIEDVGIVARLEAAPRLAPRARRVMLRSRALVEKTLRTGKTAYGVNTGFGHLADVHIAPRDLADLQLNLVRSHACGVGPPFTGDETRAMMLLRANTLAKGVSGVRPVVVETILSMLRADIVPVVPSQGSVGASGDLAPLAHLALALIGEGPVVHRGRPRRAAEALRSARIAPLRLAPKEGLSLINGTQAMTAVGALVLLEAEALTRHADLAGAMSLEALKGSAAPFDPRIHDVRPHAGQKQSAANLRRLLRASEIMDSHRDCGRVQDSYALRCMPQVHGAVADALAPLDDAVSVELNAATDNPLVFPDGRVVSGGNFHGEPLALALDHARLALTALATISERRSARILDARLSGLPAFLASDPGLESGLMLAQYSAAAAVNELKTTVHPAAADTIPTSANQEDHVSMGATSALLLRDALDRATTVLAVEALCAARGLDLRAPLNPGRGVAAAHAAVRAVVPPLDGDRSPAPDIAALSEAIRAGTLAAVAD